MKKVYIAGAGGFGREVLAWLEDSPEFNRQWSVAGFLDDNTSADFTHLPRPMVGTIQDFNPKEGDLIVIGVGTPGSRKNIVETLAPRGTQFMSYVHPSVITGSRITFGRGTFLCPGSILTCDISIGDFSFLNLKVTVGHDVRIGAYCGISSQVDLCGGVVLEDEVFVGSGASIIPSRHIGQGALIGAGSTVTRNVPAHKTVFGSPAKKYSF